MVNCSQLEIINISSNSFVILPHVLLDIPSLAKINAGKNFIAGKMLETLHCDLKVASSHEKIYVNFASEKLILK